VQRTYRFRLYPNAEQDIALNGMLGAFCDLYNAALEERIDRYRKTGRTLSYNVQALQLKEVRAIDERLAAFSFTTAQQVLRRLDKAFAAFFRRVKTGEKPGFPRFQSKRRFDSVEMRVGDGLTLRQQRLRIAGIDGLLKVRWHRSLPHNGTLGHAVLSRNGGRWHICFAVDLPDAAPRPRDFAPVGMDVGVSSLVALSTGETIANPKWTASADATLRRLNRSLARKRRYSRGWKKAKVALCRHHARVAYRRNDTLHKLSARLVREHSHIAVEALNVKGLARGMLAKEVLSAGWATFFNMLRYKAESAGSVVEAVDPAGTSQTCPACGGSVVKTLADRWHSCPQCGYEADRDVAAAQVVLLRARFLGPGTGLGAQSKPATVGLAPEAVCLS
jgi:putative transposase